MTEKTVTTYIAVDGKEFDDEMACGTYELNLLYRASGIRLFIGRKEVKEFSGDDIDVENYATSMTIDRSKKAENDAFMDFYRHWSGCCYLVDAYNGLIDAHGSVSYGEPLVYGTKYRAIKDSEKHDINTDMVCLEQVNVCPCCMLKKTLKNYYTGKDHWGDKTYEWMCQDCYKKGA